MREIGGAEVGGAKRGRRQRVMIRPRADTMPPPPYATAAIAARKRPSPRFWGCRVRKSHSSRKLEGLFIATWASMDGGGVMARSVVLQQLRGAYAPRELSPPPGLRTGLVENRRRRVARATNSTARSVFIRNSRTDPADAARIASPAQPRTCFTRLRRRLSL